jgi:hypothetical protein
MAVLAKNLVSAAALLAAVVAFAPSAKADHVCLQVCKEGSCQTNCFESDHVYLDSQGRDFYLRHGRADLIMSRD